MPEGLQFNTLAERIVHMSDPKSMVGELEVQSTAEVLGRPIHVSIAPGNHIVEYVPKDVCDKVPLLLVKYLPHQDAGHYECIVGLSVGIRDVSPLPNIYGSKRNISSGSKSQILTSSPYKDALELNTKTKEKKNRAKGVKARHKLDLPKNVRKRKSTTSRGGKERRKAKERYTSSSSDSDSSDNPFCLICCERFSESRSRENWIACSSCSNWAHLECTVTER